MTKLRISWLNERDVLVFTAQKEFEKFLKSDYAEAQAENLSLSAGRCGWIKSTCANKVLFYCFIDAKRATKCNYRRTVVHECVHLMHLLFDFYGIKDDRDNTETVAYFTEWLFHEINKIVGKRVR